MELKWELVAPIVIIQLILAIVAMVDLVKSEQPKSLNKWIWAAIIVLGSMMGPILYFLFGRKYES